MEKKGSEDSGQEAFEAPECPAWSLPYLWLYSRECELEDSAFHLLHTPRDWTVTCRQEVALMDLCFPLLLSDESLLQ